MADQQQTPVVTLSLAHRNAIREEVECLISESGDLRIYAERLDEAPNRDWIRNRVARLAIGVHLLDRLGWELYGDKDAYELTLDADVVQFMDELKARAEGALEDDREAIAAGHGGYQRLTEEEWNEELRARERLVALDLAGIGAAEMACRAWTAVA